MPAIEPGKQYLGVICRACQKPAPFVEVEKGAQLGRVGGEFEIECPRCGHKGRYPAAELRMMEAHRKQ